MSQMTFSDYEYSCRKKKTKREEFLDVMEDIIPWDEWVEFVRPYYPSGKRCRPTKGIQSVLSYSLLSCLWHIWTTESTDSLNLPQRQSYLRVLCSRLQLHCIFGRFFDKRKYRPI